MIRDAPDKGSRSGEQPKMICSPILQGGSSEKQIIGTTRETSRPALGAGFLRVNGVAYKYLAMSQPNLDPRT